MSKITTYHEKQSLFEQLQQDLAAMEEDEGLKEELQFKKKLENLMNQFKRSAQDTVEIMGTIDPKIAQKAGLDLDEPEQKKSRPKRALKTYRNPHSGEVVQTRGGNQKTLKEWKAQYGNDEVESWLETS